MKDNGARRKLVLVLVILAVTLTSTAMAQVTIGNAYDISVTPVTPGVHFVPGNSSSSDISVSLNSRGSAAYLNMTFVFNLNSKLSSNVTDFLNLSSPSGSGFSYLTNITAFTGAGTLSSLQLFSTNASGNYTQDFLYSSTSGKTAGSTPVTMSSGENSSLGIVVTQDAKSGFGGPYNWYLNFTINGEYLSHGETPSVFSQYFVSIMVTTFES